MLATPELIDEASQPRRLAEALPRCFENVPLYRPQERKIATTTRDTPWPLEQFLRSPFITKQDIRRDFPRNFLGEQTDLDSLLEEGLIELEQTSGTSEERTSLLLPSGWWAEQEHRALQLNPWIAAVLVERPDAPRLTINSPFCSGDICYAGVPSRNERIVGNALFLSLSRYPFLWSDSDLTRMAAEATEWQPWFLDVDPVYGVVFALYCERRGIRLPSLRFIVCSYEFVSVVHCRILQRVFGVPIIDLYGSTETGHLLIEDPQGGMRASLQTAFLEHINPDSSGIGELVVTTLTNSFMPLVRYRIGDLVEKFELPYGTRYRVHGRVADAFQTRGGRRVTTWEIDQCFEDLTGIAHYQLTERSADRWLLRVVPEGEGLNSLDVDRLRSRLTALLGIGGDLTIQPTDLLMPETSGKFRLGYPSREPTR